MLHITNGDSAGGTLRQAGLPGDVLPWRDLLHEGPVPAGLPLDRLSEARARFIAAQGWGPGYDDVLASFRERDAMLDRADAHDEVVLWFEHDLYDQLQLLQLLDWFSDRDLGATRLSLICIGAFPGRPEFHGLGELTAAELVSLFPARRAVSPGELALGRAAWAAFRAPDPTALEATLAGDTSTLPFLRAALLRHLEEFPAVGNGLSRTERQLLEALAASNETPHAIFHAWQAKESAPFMGDAPLWSHLHRLGAGPRPPLALADGAGSFRLPTAFPTVDAFSAQRVALTDDGRAVLAGQADHVALNGIDTWRGGAHLQAPGPLWRWVASSGKLARTL